MASDPTQNTDWRELLDTLPDSEAEFLRRIDELVELDHHDTALQRLDQALSRHPTTRLRVAFGRLALDQRKFERARRVLKPASNADDPPINAHLLLAEACLGADAESAARLALDRAERDGASGGRYTILKRRVEAASPGANDEAGSRTNDGSRSESSLNSTVDATLGDLIEASAEAGEVDDPASHDPFQSETAEHQGLHTESYAGDDLDDEENPFADMEDTVFDDGAEPDTSEIHERPDDLFGELPGTDADSQTEETVDQTIDADLDADQIGRTVDEADDAFYSDVEDTTFDPSPSPPDDSVNPPFEDDGPTTAEPTEPAQAESGGPATTEQKAPPTDDTEVPNTDGPQGTATDERQAPPADTPPPISDPGDQADEDSQTVETDAADDDTSDVFSITTSTDGTGVHLDEMLVEAPLEDADDVPGEHSSDVDELHTSPYIEEAEDDREDIQIADPEPTHLIQLDDEEDGDDERAEAPTDVVTSETDAADIEDPPTTPDRPRANDGSGSRRPSQPAQDDAPTTPRQQNEDPPTTPDFPGADQGRSANANPIQVPDEDEIPTDPEVPDAESRANAGGPRQSGGPQAGAEPEVDGAPSQRPSGRQSQQNPSVQAPSPGQSADSRRSRSRQGGEANRPPSPDDGPSASNVEDAPSVGLRPENMESGESRVTPPPRSETGLFTKVTTYVGGWEPPDWLNSRSALLVGVVTAATLTTALLFIGAMTTWIDNNRLTSALDRVEQQRASDTYQGWRSSFETADEAIGDEPGLLRRTLHSIGSMLPLTSAAVLRTELKQKRAFYAAMLEYRYEAYGERNAAALAESAFPEETALAAATDTYRLLAEGRHMEAVDRAEKAHHDHQRHRILGNAYLAALLETEQAGDVLRESSDLEARVTTPTVYERYLLARAARYQKETVAQVLFEALVQQHSPAHIDAQIERIHALNDQESYQEAKTLARKLLDESEGTASAYQRARLHIALGETHRKMGEHARAEEQFRSAIKAKPTRSSVYLPLTDLFIEDGRLDKARQEVEAAETKAQPSPPLQKRKAHLLFLRGEFAEALSHVDSDEGTSAYAPILEGRIRLELGNYKRAREVFNGVDDSHPRYSAAKSLELLARTRMGVDDPETVTDELSSLLDDGPNSPLVLRTAARIRLSYAEQTIGRAHDDHLAETFDLLEQAIDAQPNRALNQYLMCDAHLIANDGSEAAMACRKAERQNPEYLPGMLTVARLNWRSGNLTKASSVLDQLQGRFGEHWQIAKLRVRTLIDRHDIEGARSLLDEWLQRPVAEDVEFHLFDGLIAFARADYAQAVGHFQKAEQDHRYAAEAKLYRAHTLARLGELEKAESLIRDDLTVHPRWRAAAWMVFGEIRRRQERFHDAMENLELAEKHLDSGLTPPWRLSHMYKERAFTIRDEEGWDDDRVADYLDEGKRRGDTESPEIQLGLGLYYYDGPEVDLDRAATHLRKVVELQPHRCEAVRALADIYRDLRNDSGAEKMEKLDRENCDG